MAYAYYLLTKRKPGEVIEILNKNGFEECLARYTSQERGFYLEGELPYKKDIDKAPVAVASIRTEFSYGNESHLKMVFKCLDNNVDVPEARIYVEGKLLEGLLDTEDSKAVSAFKKMEPSAVYDPSICGLNGSVLGRILGYGS